MRASWIGIVLGLVGGLAAGFWATRYSRVTTCPHCDRPVELMKARGDRDIWLLPR